MGRETRSCGPRCTSRDAHEIAGGACAPARSDSPLERAHELEEGGRRRLRLTWRDRLGNADTPRQLLLAGRQPRRHTSDRPERDAKLELALKRTAALRCLVGVDAIEDERIEQVVAVGDVQEPRPQLVVLALGELLVVSERVPVEHSTLDEHGRVQERRAEERSPADVGGPAGHRVHGSDSPIGVELQRRRADDRYPRCRLHPRELELQPARHCDIVGVDPSDVRTTRRVESAIERGGEAELLVVSEHAQARVVDRLENLGRPVGRRVVHDDELELRDGLPENACDRGSEKRLAVVDGEEHGDERHGRHGRHVAYGPCRGSFRRSTSSSRRLGRTDELAVFLDSVEAQAFERLRVIVVDQNDDERVAPVVHWPQRRA